MEECKIPVYLQNSEFRFLRVKPLSKQPIDEWKDEKNHLHHDDPILLLHIKNGGNVGVLGGYGNLTVIDSDTKELTEHMQKILPKTLTEKSAKGIHFFYQCSDFTGYKELSINETHFGEVRGDISHQTNITPSVHETGVAYEITENVPIATISKSQLEEAVKPFIVERNISWEKFSYKKGINVPIEKIIDISLLKKLSGNEVQGVHPFHGSTTGQNFCVNVEKNVWFCFRHNSGGSGLHLIAQKEGIIKCGESLNKKNFEETIELAENKYGIDISENGKFIGIIKFTDYIDMAEQFYNIQPYFYDKNNLWWFWNKSRGCWEIIDEIDLMNGIDAQLLASLSTTKTDIKNQIIESLKRVGRKHIPNQLKGTCIQFTNTIFDIETGDSYNSSPEYFAVNPIPWELGETEDTPVMDKIFEEWVGKKYIPTLYEIIAYSMIPSYTINRLFCLVGAGSNGKSKFLGLIIKFLGKQNCCSTDLDTLLLSRFESGKLYKKLFCSMGETNFTAIKKTERLKRLTGEDLVGFEFKNKMPFEDISYAKIVIATNSLPITYDKTLGFYRRWLIVSFPNQFSEKRDILSDIPDQEYRNLTRKCVRILSELLKKREFTNEGTVKDREEMFERISNPIVKFIEEFCIEDINGKILFSEFEQQFSEWLKQNKYRQYSSKELGTILKNQGIGGKTSHINRNGKDTTTRYILGYEWKESDNDDSDDNGSLTRFINKETSENTDKIDKIDNPVNGESGIPTNNNVLQLWKLTGSGNKWWNKECSYCGKLSDRVIVSTGSYGRDFTCEKCYNSFKQFDLFDYIKCKLEGKQPTVSDVCLIPSCERCEFLSDCRNQVIKLITEKTSHN